MRRQSIVVGCDNPGCKTLVEVASIHPNEVPFGWYRVIPPGNENLGGVTVVKQGAESFDLCSPKCVAQWARERGKVESELTPGNFPCGVCDFVGETIQGLRAHERNSHNLNLAGESR